MKRCPECGREYDNTMMFCLDDGAELLYGPALSEPPAAAGGQFGDEPQTAILHSTDVSGEAPTRAQIHTTAAEPQGKFGEPAEEHSFSASRAKPLLIAIGLAVVVLGGFFGYKYFTASKQFNSIAVMPFVNESGNQDVEYLSDGMTETLINSLTEIPNLSVKARSSVFHYKGKNASPKQIGEELNVEVILLGRVTQRGDDIKLNLELVDTKTLDNLWSANYDRKTSDLVTLQSEIAKDVSTKIKTKLSGAEEEKVTKTGTKNVEAYQAYLKGRYFWNRRTGENIKKAIEQFKIAADKDPNYALAYSGLADSYSLLPDYAGTPTSETMPQARAFAEKALSLDPMLAETHASLGLINYQLWQWEEAEKEFKKAIELNPNYASAYHWYTRYLNTLGKHDEALATIKRARELDPLSSIIGVNVSGTYQKLNRHEESIEVSLKTIELDPNFGAAHSVLGLSYLKLGRTKEAVTASEKAAELTDRASVRLSDLGFVYAAAGDRTKANAIIKELEANYARKEAVGHDLAAVYAGLGELDKAFEWLEKDFEVKESGLPTISWKVEYEPLRDDPRFKDLMKRMGLPE